MRAKEKLERVGWTFRCTWGNKDEYEVYGRGDIRIVYDPEKDRPMCFYNTKERFGTELCVMTDLRFDIFCEPFFKPLIKEDEKEDDS